MNQKIDTALINRIIKSVIANTSQMDQEILFEKDQESQAKTGKRISAVSQVKNFTPENDPNFKQLDWFKHVGPVKTGHDREEVVIAVSPAFAEVFKKTLTGLSHWDVLRQLTAGIEEEGLKFRVMKIYRTSDVSFCAAEADQISGSGISIAIQSKGTTIIHQKDQEPLDNLELFPQAPVLTLETYRAIGRNAARYAKGMSPDPVPTVNDMMARVQYQPLSGLMHIQETRRVQPGKDADEIELKLD